MFLRIFVVLSGDVNKKLEKYRMCNKNLLWFKNYLSNRKQYFQYKEDFSEQKSTDLLQLKCGMPQGSILATPFLIYINDLSLVSKYLSSILFADDTNLFYSQKNTNMLFKNAIDEIEKIFLYHKQWDKKNLSLQALNLTVNNYKIKRSSSIKFLGALVDQIKIVENKISKNLGLLYKTKNYLNRKPMVNPHYSFMPSYLNQGNIACCSSSITKLEKLASKQKQVLRTIPILTLMLESRSKQIMKDICILNIYQLNICNVLKLMFQVKKWFKLWSSSEQIALNFTWIFDKEQCVKF